MVEQEQIRPLTLANHRLSSDDEEAARHLKKIRRKRCIKCFGCITVPLVIIAIVIVILIFTVFRFKQPKIKLNKVVLTHMELVNNTNLPKPGTNISLIVDVSVKNPNSASFKYDNTTTGLYYHGVLVGEAQGPPGHSKARRTVRMNATVDLIVDKLISSPNLSSDVSSGLLRVDSYTKVPGKVKIVFVKRHVTIKMNCSMTVNMSSMAIQKQHCKNKVDY